jgi:RHS repeat-associated protein
MYDAINRLTFARSTTPSGGLISDYRYTYDGASNMINQTVNNGTTTLQTPYSYNAANELTTQAGVTFTYDANGNVTGSSAGAALAYDAGNRMTAIRPAFYSGTPASFAYRGDGQSERYGAGPVPPTTSGPVCALTVCSSPPPPSQTATTQYEFSSLGITAQTNGALPTYFIRDPRGGLLGERTPTADYYYLRDSLGSVVSLADVRGQVAGSYAYDSFGQTLSATGVAAANPWRFAGQYLDGTGLYKMGERYYDPSLGRWTQQDPIVNALNPLQWNRYVYVGDNPVNYTDPNGTDTGSCVGQALATAVVAAVIFGFFGFFGGYAVGTLIGGFFESVGAAAGGSWGAIIGGSVVAGGVGIGVLAKGASQC